jgi:hypothetical protein
MSLTPTVTFRVDVSGTAFGGAPTWTDLSSRVLAEGQGAPIDITWGRHEEDGAVTASVMTILLDNQDGALTPKRAASAFFPFWRSGMRGNLRLTFNGTTYDRFDGLADTIVQAFPGGSEGWSVVMVTFNDISVRLAANQPLRSMLQQEMLADAPTYLYGMGEAAGSSSCGDLVGANGPAVRKDGKYGAGTMTFGTDMTLADPATGVNFGLYSANPGVVSVLSLPTVIPAAAVFSLEVWFVAPATISATAQPSLLWQVSVDGGSSFDLHVVPVSGVLECILQDPANFAVLTMAAKICDGKLHQAVVTLDADRKTAHLYVDGALVVTSAAAAALNFTAVTMNQVGGNTSSFHGGQFQGTIANHALYPTTLSAAAVLRHYQCGVGTFSEASGARFARLATYGAVPTTGLPAGVAVMGTQNTAGKTALTCLQDVGKTENGPVFVTGAGALTFQARNTRYNATAGLSLVADDVDPGISPQEDRTDLTNDLTVTRDGGSAQRVINTTSEQTYGTSDPGGYTVYSTTDYDALQNAAWQVAINKDSHLRIPGLLVDLLTQPNTTAGKAKVQAVLAAGISTLCNLSGMPTIGPATSIDLFIEGGHERIGLLEWSVEFFTSPNIPATLRADGSATVRTKLDSGLKIPF